MLLSWWRKQSEKTHRKLSPNSISHFIDQSLGKQYLEDGYIVLSQAIAKNFIDDLQIISEKFIDYINKEFAYSTMILEESQNLQIHQQCNQRLQPALNQIFSNYKAYSSTFLVKPAQTNSQMQLHQDWSFTDEDIYLPTTLWLPLQDVNNENGAIFLIKNSHTFFNNRRSNSLPTARIDSSGILKDFIKTISLKKGDLLLFNPAVFHGSHANTTSKHRIAFTMTIMSKNAPFLYYHQLNKKQVQVLNLEDNALLKQMKIFNQDGGIYGNETEIIEYKHEIPSAKILFNLSKKTLNK